MTGGTRGSPAGSTPQRRMVAVVALVAAASLAIGLLASRWIVSPQEAAARAQPPEPTPITVPIELRELRSQVVARGDVEFDGASDIALETSGLTTPAVVTGVVPERGDTISEGDVLLELAGRPVYVLGGDLPTYRTLAPGLTGPDVVQLKAALDRLELDPGELDSDTYDAATAAAVRRLYERSGHPPAAAPDDIAAQLVAAQQGLVDAEDALVEAEHLLERARSQRPSAVERLQADAMVEAAEQALAQAKASDDEVASRTAEHELKIAKAQREQLLAPADTTVELAAVERARQQLDRARASRGAAERDAATPLPAAEVVFLPDLPRRVDAVHVRRGELVDGPTMRVSGAELIVVATVSSADRQLLTEGMEATLETATSAFSGRVSAIRDADGGHDDRPRHEVRIVPEDLTVDEVDELRGVNVRVSIPIDTTEGQVLAVPLAALSAGPSGESRIEIERSDGTFELVEVEAGLAAEGYAEIRPVDNNLSEGDLVVVGR